MRITAQITGHRQDEQIIVPVSLVDGSLEFMVPTVNRAAACSFSVDLSELQEAISHLTPTADAPVKGAPADG